MSEATSYCSQMENALQLERVTAFLSDGCIVSSATLRYVWKSVSGFFRDGGPQAIYYAMIRIDGRDRYFVWNTPDGPLSVPIDE